MQYLMFNKPRGCITARSDPRHATVMEYFPEEMRDSIFPVGRLDRDTEGFLIFTDDGDFCFHINEPTHKMTKTYRFYAKGEFTEEKLFAMCNGVCIDDRSGRISAPAEARLLGFSTMRDISHLLDENEARLKYSRKGDAPLCHIELTVTEGKKHQVKKMARAVGLYIVYLERVAIGDVHLDSSLERGEYRPLSQHELSLLMGK